MKSEEKEQGKWFNHLRPEYEDKFADYLSEFVKQFTNAGIPIYAISPMNEPEFFNTEWDGCFWLPFFIPSLLYKLRKSLLSKNLNTKIISSENANWTLANLYLTTILSMINEKYKEPYPIDILASHGYSGLQNPGDLNTNPYPWVKIDEKMPRWITEACSAVDYDDGMGIGLKLAESMHNFVFNQGVSAYLYWLGVVTHSNESLITSDGSNYSINKTYDVMGNFSRYIKPGFKTLEVSTDKPDDNVLFSAYKSSDSKNFTCVIINKNKDRRQISIKIDQKIVALIPYVTTEEKNARWKEGNPITKNNAGEYHVVLPKNSVTTLIS